MYVTFKYVKTQRQIAFQNFFNGIQIDPRSYQPLTQNITVQTEHVPDKYDITSMVNALKMFNEAHKDLINVPDKHTLYETFHIPKKTGGLRTINAPLPALKAALSHLKILLETYCLALPHNAAHAYVKGRSTLTSIQKHQTANSKWFLKVDLKDFFPSCSLDFIMSQLEQVFPFSEIIKQDRGALETALSLGILDNGLPQGTPLSPLLTNLIMIPTDYQIHQYCLRKHLIYTRYADDILISCKHKTRVEEAKEKLPELIQAPLRINNEKTRIGSSSGRNWNLGLMLNKDNQITIGYKNKMRFKAMLNNFLNDLTNGRHWDKLEVQTLQGLVSYYSMIEREYIEYLTLKYTLKYNTAPLKEIFRQELNIV